MIEGSLKFHSEKMSFEKSKTRYPKTRLSCLQLSRVRRFSRLLVTKNMICNSFPAEKSQAQKNFKCSLSHASPKTESRVELIVRPPTGTEFVWLGVETGRKCFRKCSRSIEKSFVKQERASVRCSPPPLRPLYRSYSLSVLTWSLHSPPIRSVERRIYINLYMCEPTRIYVDEINKKFLHPSFASILSLHHPETSRFFL